MISVEQRIVLYYENILDYRQIFEKQYLVHGILQERVDIMSDWNEPIIDLDRYQKELAYLVNIDSSSSEPVGSGKVAAFFQDQYERMGWQVEALQFAPAIGPCLKITNTPAEHYDILLLAHLDTVFPLGTAAKRPFSCHGNRAMGPGVVDCKGGALSGLYVLRALQEKGVLQGKHICVFLNSDHEGISSRYSKSVNQALARKSACALVLECGRANGNLVYQRKGIARYYLKVTGRSAHAGVDYKSGRNAIEELAYWIIALQGATDFAKETTVNVGLVEGGTAINAVPGEAKAAVDVRYYDRQEILRIEQLMQGLQQHPHVPDTQVEIDGGITRPPMLPTDKTRQLMQLIEAQGKRMGVAFGWTASGGGSDGSFAADAGTPTIDGLGPVGGGAHTEREYMEIDSVIPRARLLAAVMEAVLQQPVE